MAVVRGEDHAADGVAVQGVDEVGQRLFFDVEPALDFHVQEQFRVSEPINWSMSPGSPASSTGSRSRPRLASLRA